MMEAIVPPKSGFLEEPHSVTSHKTAFVIVTAVKTSKLLSIYSTFDRHRLLYLQPRNQYHFGRLSSGCQLCIKDAGRNYGLIRERKF
jgi:hypothetical protein